MRELPSFVAKETAMIHSIPSWEYDNTPCRVVGVACDTGPVSEDVKGSNIFYIVELCRPTKEGWTHVQLTNACLKKIPDEWRELVLELPS